MNMKVLIIIFILFGVIMPNDDEQIKAKPQVGIASFYANKFEGRKTASGQIFRQAKMTGASNRFKLGDSVLVVNQTNQKSVKVYINDRIGTPSRLIDLSLAAAKELDMVSKGLVKVSVTKVN
jgi:rare lipoprotein A